jgi:beta-glucosidase
MLKIVGRKKSMPKSRQAHAILTVLCCLLGWFFSDCVFLEAQQDNAEMKADALVAKMTTQQKIGQLNQQFDFSSIPGMPTPVVSLEDQVRSGELGSILFVSDPLRLNRLQKIAVEESPNHIPLLFGFDVIHGWDTEYPVPIGMAASWDTGLIEKVQASAAEEAAAAGIHWAFAPMLDIARDPRWGRISEGAGEDPYLGSAIARAQVYGFQGRPGTAQTFMATLKHFAGYGAAEGGRDYDAAYIPDEEMHNVYLRPFQAGIDAGASSVMSAYMDLNDIPASGNVKLLRDQLRGELGFRGFIVSDANAVGDLVTHGYAKDGKDAAIKAARAGVNMDMGSASYITNIQKMLSEGSMSIKELDDLVRPLLVAKFRIGLFEHPYANATAATHNEMLVRHRPLSRQMAAESAVLLRNDGNLLPLNAGTKRIAIVGPLADSQVDMNGPWSLTAKPADTVSALAAIRTKLSQENVSYAKGVQIAKDYTAMFDSFLGPKPEPRWSDDRAKQELEAAVKIAKNADVVVMALGELAGMDFEYSSRSSLALPGNQQELLEKVVATGKPVVLLLFSTRPLDLEWASTHVTAIMDCYFGGTEAGNAIADLLFGESSPSGKLPISWPRTVGQVPVYYAHNLSHMPYDSKTFTSRYWDLPTAPLYPFGFGLTYSKFNFTNLRLGAREVGLKGTVSVTVHVENSGDRSAEDIVQLYLHQRSGSASRPARELKGFERIALNKGEGKDVTFLLTPTERTYWSGDKHDWVLDSSDFDVWVGDSSQADLHSEFSVVSTL